MGMSMHVVGFRLPDDLWKKHKAVWDACESAGVAVPDETEEFFQGEAPDSSGVLVELEHNTHGGLVGCCQKFQAEGEEGFEITLAHLPPNLAKIRFYCSW